MLNTPAQCRQFSCGCNGLKLHDGQESQSSRRSFIQQVGGLGAGAAIGGAGAFNLSSAFAADQQVIDTHHHFYSPSYQKAWLDWDDKYNIPHFPTQVAWTQDKAVEAMDAGERYQLQHPLGNLGIQLRLDAGGRLCRLHIPTRFGEWHGVHGHVG